MKNLYYILIFLALGLISCDEDNTTISSVDDRREEAVNELRELLTAPSDGWLLNYQPTRDAGSYLILLEFAENEVRVQSDLPQDSGAYYDQTIPYRIDPQLSLELIFESYGVFHFLFEQDQSTFGAEFEFVFVEEDNGALSFASKTDPASDLTVISITPAPADAADGFSREIAENMLLFEEPGPIIFGGQVLQQVYLVNDNISIFWDIDLVKRRVILDAAAQGNTISEIVSINNLVPIVHETGYALRDGKLILNDPFDFQISGSSYSFSEITLTSLSQTGDILCQSDATNSYVYSGNAAGLGPAELRQTMFESDGLKFTEQTDAYSVNALFVFDDEGFSLLQSGSIGELYPEATGFIFHYGFVPDSTQNQSLPAYGVGIQYIDDNNVLQLNMREYDMVTRDGNEIEVVLNDNFYISGGDSTVSEQNIRAITDEIFTDSQFYISDLPIEGSDILVFRLYSVCSGYEFFLVQPE